MQLYTIQDNKKIYDSAACFHYLNEAGKMQYGQNFQLQREDHSIIMKLLLYAIKDEDGCRERNIDLRKGILLSGPVGCGKTSLMSLVRPFFDPDRRHLMKPARDITFEFIKDGYQVIHKYGKSSNIYCFDDLGIEQNIKHFGNECNTMAEILLSRYDHLIHSRVLTHGTTNLNANELETVYGNRVRSRLREMFNLISFPSTAADKRK